MRNGPGSRGGWTVALLLGVASLSIGLVTGAAPGDDASTGRPREEARRLMAEAARKLAEDPGDVGSFLRSCLRAAELAPDDEMVMNNLGYAWELSGEYRKAAEAYREAIRLNPGWKMPYYGLADVLVRQGKYDEAMSLYERGLGLPCRSDEDRRNDAETLEHLERLQRELPNFARKELIVAFLRGELGGGKGREARARGLVMRYDEGSFEGGGPAAEPGGGGAADPPCEDRLILQHVYFGLDQFSIAEGVHEQVDVLGEALKETLREGVVVRLIGHASPDGPEDYNLELSRKRALAVRDYLVERFGIPRDRILVSWKGESEPLRDADGRVDLERSRRVEVGRPCR